MDDSHPETPVPECARLEPGAPRDGWHSRGYIPHFDSPNAVQHVTFHLADSLPAAALARLEGEVRATPPERRDAERRKRFEACFDAGYGCCILRHPEAAHMVQDSFLRFDGERYRLLAWVVMPNHVHVLFQTIAGWTMARIVASWKSFTGRELSPLMPPELGTSAVKRVWSREYWDRAIRDERHFHATVEYIHDNPVKAGLVRRPEDWQWSSARPELRARMEPGAPSGFQGAAAP